MGDFQSTLDKFFPGAIPAAQFVRQSYDALWKHGFTRDNTFAGVGLCRDELTRPLFHEIEKMWGEVFNISSLAGMLLLGKAGFRASLHHAPHDEGLPRHVYYALPHIGINSSEEIGYCYRPGQKQASTACGALMGFQQELASGILRVDLDPDDLEYSLLKQRLIRKLHYGKVPGIVTLTKLAHETIRDDLQRLIDETIDITKSHHAMFTGIQIHGPNSVTYVWPEASYAVSDGQRYEFPRG